MELQKKWSFQLCLHIVAMTFSCYDTTNSVTVIQIELSY